MPSSPTSRQLQAEARLARRVLATEAHAIRQLVIGPAFHQAVDLILRRTALSAGPARSRAARKTSPTHQPAGSLVVSGMGKSGIIGMKISATFASLGTPSHFLHPAEALHGDLGRIRPDDVVLLLSYAGSTDEILDLAAILRQDSVPIIAMTGQPKSPLARLADIVLNLGTIREACPHNLAPTATTTAMLALGDALAIALAARRRFSTQDFQKTHPGGSLGRQLLPVTQIMRFKAGENLALIPQHLSVRQAYALAQKFRPPIRPPGALLIIDARGRLAGIFTDGDLRRLVFSSSPDVIDQPISRFMTPNPKRLPHTAVVRDAVHLVRQYRIDEIPIVDSRNRPLGLIDVQDLMALKVVQD